MQVFDDDDGYVGFALLWHAFADSFTRHSISAEYYYNRVTRESQWEKPDEMKELVDWQVFFLLLSFFVRVLTFCFRSEIRDIGDSGWQQVLVPGRPVYFFDTNSNCAHWTLPAALAPVLLAQERQRLADAERAENEKVFF